MKFNEKLEQIISNGEDSYTQFKINFTNADKLAMELVAFSNARGGIVVSNSNYEKISILIVQI